MTISFICKQYLQTFQLHDYCKSSVMKSSPPSSEKNAVKHSLLKVELRLAEKEKAKKNIVCTSLCSVASSSKKIAISYDVS